MHKPRWLMQQATSSGGSTPESPAPRPHLQVENLGQVFTPPDIVQFMQRLCRNRGRVLEPSAGAGAFLPALKALASPAQGAVALEIDPGVAPPGVQVQDFFTYPLHERFDTIIGNPPYVRFQDIPASTRAHLDAERFDSRSNLFLFFIEKCIRHLNPGGELVFIVPREFIKLTGARKLNRWLFEQGSITDFYDMGDRRLFGRHTPNCAIFRFESGNLDRKMRDGRHFSEVDGQLLFLKEAYPLRLKDLFTVKVGGVSGADPIFTHPEGNQEFVYSQTLHTGQTRRMLHNTRHPHLLQHKATLLQRRVRRFDENNWWTWGRQAPEDPGPRIYVNSKTRHPQPFFLHDCTYYDGSILGLFPHKRNITPEALQQLVQFLNTRVNWQELGFICDGRFLFTQRSLSTTPLPALFADFLP